MKLVFYELNIHIDNGYTHLLYI